MKPIFPKQGYFRRVRVSLTLMLVLAALGSACQLAGDPIEQAGRETRQLLAAYERDHRTEPVLDFLAADHGEAPGNQVLLHLGNWGQQHPQEFIELLKATSRWPKAQQQKWLENLRYSLGDSGQDRTFAKVFKPYQAETPLLAPLLKPESSRSEIK